MPNEATTSALSEERMAQLRRLAESLFSGGSSDARAGLGSLVREIEAAHPGFIARLNAVNDLQRLGLSIDGATTH